VTLFDRIGADALRAVVTDFYAKIFLPDVMIGFMFAGKDKQQLIDREYELVAALLGAPVKYAGRPMRVAHAQHRIFGGHFERRLQLLKDTLREHAVDPDVQAKWIEHTLALRAQITKDRGSECATSAEATAAPKLAVAPPAPKNPDAPVKLGRRG
jgi:truncated hemoglobin YjbI